MLVAQELLNLAEAPDAGHDHQDPTTDGIEDGIRGGDAGQDRRLIGSGKGGVGKSRNGSSTNGNHGNENTIYFTEH